MAAALAAGLPAPAQAQVVSLDPSAATGCLTPAADQRGVPEYPFDAWKRNEKGRVLVSLSFTTPDKRPAVKVLESEGGGDFEAAVREHVATYRVPCLNDAGPAPAELRFEFVFRPDERKVYTSAPVDELDGSRSQQLKCVQHTSGKVQPEFPTAALRAEIRGRVLARLRFTTADQPPEVQVFSRPSASVLAKGVERWVQGYRMPCFDGAGAVSGMWQFTFKFAGEKAYGLKPTTLVNFMSQVRGIRQQALQFDTTTMGCPFDLRLTYRQPFMANSVGEIGQRDIARQPLLAWLRAQHLDLQDRALDAVFGDDTVITVPCARIDLKPKETS